MIKIKRTLIIVKKSIKREIYLDARVTNLIWNASEKAFASSNKTTNREWQWNDRLKLINEAGGKILELVAFLINFFAGALKVKGSLREIKRTFKSYPSKSLETLYVRLTEGINKKRSYCQLKKCINGDVDWERFYLKK